MVGRFACGAWRSRVWALIALLAGAAGWPAAVVYPAANEVNLEQRVKAAFLYKIAGYVEWPTRVYPAQDTPFTMGVIGALPLARELSRIVAGRTVQGRPIMVRQMDSHDTLDGLHLLFIDDEHRDRLRALAPQARERSVLVVTEWEGALTQGSMVNFVIVDDRVRFEVDLGAGGAAGLRFSSRLLAVAQRVYSKAP